MIDISPIIEKFKNREVKAKEVFEIKEIDKMVAYQFVARYHYLADAKFFAMYSYGLFIRGVSYLVGCATYSLPQGTCATQGWFSLPANDPSIVELSRLCMLPELNGTNATSFLLGNSIKMLKDYKVRAVITLADASRHIGSIYQVCNFKYYGRTKNNSDFYKDDGSKNARGTPSTWHGVYLPRSEKHRYAYILDPTLKCNYKEEPRPTIKGTIATECCNDKFVVYDNRFDEYWTCPKCTSKITKITKEEYEDVIEKSKTLAKNELKEFVESLIEKHTKKENPFEKFGWDI